MLDLPRAKYPDCLSCRRWVSCPGATRENPGECPVRHEFHAHLQGCVRGRSPTCTTAGDSRRRGDTSADCFHILPVPIASTSYQCRLLPHLTSADCFHILPVPIASTSYQCRLLPHLTSADCFHILPVPIASTSYQCRLLPHLTSADCFHILPVPIASTSYQCRLLPIN
ncbi:hypothetical protein ACOMHN_066672 [Nucella lapillus]